MESSGRKSTRALTEDKTLKNNKKNVRDSRRVVSALACGAREVLEVENQLGVREAVSVFQDLTRLKNTTHDQRILQR